MLHCRDDNSQVITTDWFPPDITLGIQAKEFNLSVQSENFISHGLRVFQVPFGKLQVGYHVPFTEEWVPSGLYHTGLIGGVLQKWLSFWKVLLSPQSNAGALSE